MDLPRNVAASRASGRLLTPTLRKSPRRAIPLTARRVRLATSGTPLTNVPYAELRNPQSIPITALVREQLQVPGPTRIGSVLLTALTTPRKLPAPTTVLAIGTQILPIFPIHAGTLWTIGHSVNRTGTRTNTGRYLFATEALHPLQIRPTLLRRPTTEVRLPPFLHPPRTPPTLGRTIVDTPENPRRPTASGTTNAQTTTAKTTT